jgi:archaellum component FlaC
MITILRNANQNTLSYRKQLIEQKTKNADLNALEDNINDFKAKFGNNFRLASEHYEKAIDSIDKTIKNLEKTRDELVKSMKNLKWANDKAEDLSLEMLTKDIPSLEDHE